MNLTELITFISTAMPLLAAAVTFLIKFVKNEKVKKVLANTIRLTETLQPLIVKAEEFVHYSGMEKKQFVLTRANQFALEHKLTFDATKVSALVDTLVDTTKRVNMRDSDKIKSSLQTNEVHQAT